MSDLAAGEVTDGLEWWRAHRREASAAQMRDLLARLQAWQGQHDKDRAAHPPPFLRMAWDAVFGDEAEKVAQAVGQLETALAAA